MKPKTKPKKKTKTIQEEIEDDYYKLTKEMDKVFAKQFGKMCPEFEPGCKQCEAHLIYNKFKQDLYQAFVK
jgi:hypothetical protein